MKRTETNVSEQGHYQSGPQKLVSPFDRDVWIVEIGVVVVRSWSVDKA